MAFAAGKARYELTGALTRPPPPLELDGLGPTDTIDVGTVSLNDEQQLLVLVLGESLLRGSSGWPADMPSNRDAAARLGWTVTKFNRKLDYLCLRLADRGIAGLQAGTGERARGRRQLLVEHLVDRRVVQPADLDHLEFI